MIAARPAWKDKTLLLWAIIALACIARFVHLESDPKFENWIGYVTDEGRWVETARNFALFGELRLYPISKLHLALSSSFQVVNYAVFELTGITFWSARIFTAVCGAAIVVISYLWLRGIASGLALGLGLVVLAFEPLVVSLSRVAIPEVPSLLFAFLAFIAICHRQRRILGAAAAGVFIAIAISMKLTTLLMAPVFLVMVVLSGVTEPGSLRAHRCLAFVIGALISAMAGFFLALAAGVIGFDAFSELWRPMSNALRFGSVYTIVVRFVASPSEYGNINLLLLGAWVCSWVLLFRNEYRGTLLGEIYELSGIWAAGWFIAVGLLNYTPSRYSLHCILPLVIHIVAGLSLWRIIGPARVVAGIGVLRKCRGIAAAVWLVVPASAIASNVLVALAAAIGVIDSRLIFKLFAVAVFIGLLGFVAHRTYSAARTATGFIAFAVVAAVLQLMIGEVTKVVLPDAGSPKILPLIDLLIIAGGAAWFAARRMIAVRLLEIGSANALLCSLVLASLLLQNVPALLNPTYSIRDASNKIAHLFPDAVALQSFRAGSLLLATRIPYRDSDWHDTDIDGAVDFDQHVKFGAGFELVAAYWLVVHPRYAIKGNQRVESGAALLNVHRNVSKQRRPTSSLLHPQ